MGLVLALLMATATSNALASVKMEFCNENDYSIRWAFLALNGGLFGAPNSIEDAVGVWGDGFYVAPAGECRTSSFEIGADKVYFVFMTFDDTPRFYSLSLGGIDSVREANPIREICIPMDGEHFYYEPEAANYEGGRVLNCPRKVSRSGNDYYSSATTREMGIAQISSGIRVVGNHFLTVTIPKIENPALFDLKGAEIMAEPVVVYPHEVLVRPMSRVEGDSITYGQSVTIGHDQHEAFGFDVNNKIFAYRFTEAGELEAQVDAQANNLAIFSHQFHKILGNEIQPFVLQSVMSKGELQGFYIYNPYAGQGVYLDPSAIDVSKMSPGLEGVVFGMN